MASAERMLMRVEVLLDAGPDGWRRHVVQLPEGATVRDALQQCGELSSVVGEGGCGRCATWGERRQLDDALSDRDRLDVCRALRIDPMEARRQRARTQRRRR
jgi:putative ubiquitin-RnfH superfamily antitoxin RatB of RatAB toxin-antitoxin module